MARSRDEVLADPKVIAAIGAVTNLTVIGGEDDCRATITVGGIEFGCDIPGDVEDARAAAVDLAVQLLNHLNLTTADALDAIRDAAGGDGEEE